MAKVPDDVKVAYQKSLDQIITLVMSAFGLVAALAWNAAIQKIFTDVFGPQSSTAAMVLYAVVVTIIAVVVTLYLTRLKEKGKG